MFLWSERFRQSRTGRGKDHDQDSVVGQGNVPVKGGKTSQSYGPGQNQGVGAIGLEFARDRLNAVQLQRAADGTISLRAYAELPYPPDFLFEDSDHVSFKLLIRQVLKQGGFVGRRANTAMPAAHLNIMSVKYQVQAGQSESHAVAAAVADRVTGDVQDYVVDYLPVRRQEDGEVGLAVVALADYRTVIKYLECLRTAGLHVNVLEIGPAAIKRLVSTLHRPEGRETVLAVNFGGDKSYMSIISGRRLLFDEEIGVGELQLVQQLALALDLDTDLARKQVEQHGLGNQAEAGQALPDGVNPQIAMTLAQILKPSLIKMAENIKRALVYAIAETRGEPISRIFVLGSIGRWRGIDSLLCDLLKIPVEVIPDPLSAFGPAASGKATAGSARPELAIATGLALREFFIDG